MVGKSMNRTIIIRPLTEDEGGGYLAEIPSLPGCASDGETPQAAALRVQDAASCWLATAEKIGHPIPAPE